LIVVAILAIVAVMAVPEIQKAGVRAKSASETENLRLIESAKAQFARTNPGSSIGSVSDLLPFLPNGRLPVSPWDGDKNPAAFYQNVLDLTQPTESPANGMAGKEPPIQPLFFSKSCAEFVIGRGSVQWWV
jgi:type II secretory pathway pseudopilin PulG